MYYSGNNFQYSQVQKDVQISVKQGNILDEHADAIVNSTGKELSFTSTSKLFLIESFIIS